MPGLVRALRGDVSATPLVGGSATPLALELRGYLEGEAGVRQTLARRRVISEPTGTVTSGVRRGLRWKLYSQGYSQITRIVVAVLLARALTPHDYGEIGMAAVFVTLVLIFSDLAFGTALIQRPEITEDASLDDLLAHRPRSACC